MPGAAQRQRRPVKPDKGWGQLMVMNERTLNGHIADAMDEQAPPGFEIWAEEHGTDQQGATVPDIHVDMPYGLQ